MYLWDCLTYQDRWVSKGVIEMWRLNFFWFLAVRWVSRNWWEARVLAEVQIGACGSHLEEMRVGGTLELGTGSRGEEKQVDLINDQMQRVSQHILPS